MKKYTLGMSVLILMLFTVESWAHGEDRFGPHKGYIRMPGAFHTEVVQQKESFRVYLLDMNWKNPVVKGSSVTANLIQAGDKKVNLTCSAAKDFFNCVWPKDKGPEKSERLELKASREGLPGTNAVYKLPLKLEPSSDGGHEGHH